MAAHVTLLLHRHNASRFRQFELKTELNRRVGKIIKRYKLDCGANQT